jgi:hypothetical protein
MTRIAGTVGAVSNNVGNADSWLQDDRSGTLQNESAANIAALR